MSADNFDAVFQEKLQALEKEFQGQGEEIKILVRDMALLQSEIALRGPHETKKRTIEFLSVAIHCKIARLTFQTQVESQETLVKLFEVLVRSILQAL